MRPITEAINGQKRRLDNLSRLAMQRYVSASPLPDQVKFSLLAHVGNVQFTDSGMEIPSVPLTWIADTVNAVQFAEEWREEDHPRDAGGRFSGAGKVAVGVAKAVLPGAAKTALFALGHVDLGLSVLAASVAHEVLKNLGEEETEWREQMAEAMETVHDVAHQGGSLSAKKLKSVWGVSKAVRNGKMSREEAVEFLRTLTKPGAAAKARFMRQLLTIAGTIVMPPGGVKLAKMLWKKWKNRRQSGGRTEWRKQAKGLANQAAQSAKGKSASQLRVFGHSIEHDAVRDKDIAAFVKKVITESE